MSTADPDSTTVPSSTDEPVGDETNNKWTANPIKKMFPKAKASDVDAKQPSKDVSTTLNGDTVTGLDYETKKKVFILYTIIVVLITLACTTMIHEFV
jgi:hypothetical protein